MQGATSQGMAHFGPMPSPVHWAIKGISEEEPLAAWREFQTVLTRLGFENAVFALECPRFKLEMPAREQMLGHIVSETCERGIRSSEDGGAGFSVAPSASCNLAQSIDPYVEIARKDLPILTERALTHLIDHGFKGGWTFPVVDRRKNTFTALLLDCTCDRDDQQRLRDQHHNYLHTSVAQLREGIEVRRLLDAATGPLLSLREEECLGWTSSGRTTKEVSSLLGIAPSTADEHIKNAMTKLGAANRAQAAARSVLLGYAAP